MLLGFALLVVGPNNYYFCSCYCCYLNLIQLSSTQLVVSILCVQVLFADSVEYRPLNTLLSMRCCASLDRIMSVDRLRVNKKQGKVLMKRVVGKGAII